LDLSDNPKAAAEWAAARFATSEIVPLDKVTLKWSSRRASLARVRALRPDAFCVFAADWKLQNGRTALMLFAILAGARRVIMNDGRGHETSRSRTEVLLLEVPRFLVELLAGYGLIIPLSWLLTEALTLSRLVRGPVRASRITDAPVLQQAGLGALYLRATLTNASQGGMSTHVAGFAGGARALGHRLTFLMSGSQSTSDDEQTRIPVSILIAPTKALLELWNNLVFTAKSLARRKELLQRVDFIYQRYSRFNWTGVVLSLVSGLPLALEYNGSEVWIGRHWDRTGVLWLLKRFELQNLRAADFIFVVSEVEKRNLVQTGMNPARIVVNPNGVDPETFKPDCGGLEVRRSFGLEQHVVVGFVGTFGPWHGAPVLAQAAGMVVDKPRCHFLFVGTGEQRAQTESVIASSGVGFTFSGSVPHHRVPAFLDACDILVSPHVPSSDGTEFFGSPTKLFEYLAMGKGIVASRLGQIAEVIVDNVNGLLVEPGNPVELATAIETLSVDEELRTRLGDAARKTAIERYTWQRNAARVFDAIAAHCGPHERSDEA
jgi:glycosyltransferase involved in cell wall biosynthesis